MEIWLARIAKAVTPALIAVVSQFLDRVAARLETKSAVKAAKAAKTIEELRDASKRICNATNRV